MPAHAAPAHVQNVGSRVNEIKRGSMKSSPAYRLRCASAIAASPSPLSASGVGLAYVYFEEDPSRRGLVNRLSGAEAKAVAQRSPGADGERRRSEALNRSMLLLGGTSYSSLVDRSPNRVERNRRNLRLILLRLFGFAIAVLLSFRHGRSPSFQFGSREADMARSRRRERTRANKNAPPLHPRSGTFRCQADRTKRLRCVGSAPCNREYELGDRPFLSQELLLRPLGTLPRSIIFAILADDPLGLVRAHEFTHDEV